VKIGVLGTGHIGATLVRQFRGLGHDVHMANAHGPESLQGLALETGARPALVTDVVKGVDLVVVTIPLKAVVELPKGLFKDVPRQTIVVDTCNYYPMRDGTIAEIEAGMPESVWVSRQLGRPVLKAFNSITAKSLAEGGLPKGSPGRIALPIAGDDSNAKKVLAKLMDDIGFDPFDAGALEQSWRQQPGAPAYCTNLDLQRLPDALKQTERETLPKRRDENMRKRSST
jgi:predicted dinucleotide-binding enzyme